MSKDDLKKLLLSFKEEDYWKHVDLHIHSCESDGKMTPYEIFDQAKRKGKKYIAISDHNTIEAYLSTNILRDEMVIPAVEFDCLYKGVLIHILGYGINIDDEEIKELFAKSKYGKSCNLYRVLKLRNPKTVIEKINQAGGIAVIAHPACYWCFNLDSFVKGLIDMGLEGIETYYPYNGLRGILKFHLKHTVFAIAAKYNLIKTGGTDSHGKKLL